MRGLLVLGCVLLVAGCGGKGSHAVVVVPSSDRLDWVSQLGTINVVPDPALVARVKRAASASGAEVLDVGVLSLSAYGQHLPVVTLESADPASYMRHRLRGFLEQIGYFKPEALAFVELVDTQGRFAWSAGRWTNGGMVHSRPDLDQCSPISHSEPAGANVPPCPAR